MIFLKQSVFKARLSSILKNTVFIFGAVAVPLFVSMPAQAETIKDALALSYLKNPELAADRARQRAQDEVVPQARSNALPRMSVDGNWGNTKSRSEPNSPLSDGHRQPFGVNLSVTQSIFRGFRTVNAIKGAKASIAAGAQTLRTTEQSVLQSAASAYLQLVAAKEVLKLRKNNVKVLRRQFEATKARMEIGQVTRTDVSQSRASYSQAISALSGARGDLQSAEAEYQRVVGKRAKGVYMPKRLANLLPRTRSTAVQIGLKEHPGVLSALYLERAALHELDQIKGERLPEVNVQASYGYNEEPSIGTDENETVSVTGSLTFPFYQGGLVASRIRQAKQTVLQRRSQIAQQRRAVRANIISTWSQYKSLVAQLSAQHDIVKANKIALEGVRAEETVGQRTILDVLDAEQDHLDALVNLVTTKSDLRRAEYNLLVAMGRLNITRLNLRLRDGAYAYNPEHNYRKVHRRVINDRIDHQELDRRPLVDLSDLRNAFDRLNRKQPKVETLSMK